ncbi:MAG TPA: SO2930 family diheme c-type cytochrome [Parvularculaceae bacterium]|nr:SO2930 family diheme c-type cytochrome [Parvularculaceae bacterium]
MRFLVALLLLAIAACAREEAPSSPVFHEEGYPATLSEWRLMSVEAGTLSLAPGVTPYDLATPLFTDYALKLRTITLPAGESAVYDDNDVFDMPVGTIISKTFYYPMTDAEWTGDVVVGPSPTVENGSMPLAGLRLVETRLLVHRADGWVAIPYRWNDEQTEAVLHRTGAAIPMTLHRPDGREEAFAYVMPNQNQCAGCHATNNTTRAIMPIGLKTRHLNKPSSFIPGFNQLDWLLTAGLLAGVPADASAAPKNVDWTDETAHLDLRARAYLDANCAHCHSDVGPADTSGLDLRPDVPFGPKYGACKTPVAAGGGSGGRPFDIVPGEPENSIFVYRMATTKPGDMMPELGRSTTHEEGVALIADWIRSMEGACG